jgi:cbb3-type cytochrome oxidase maturation protein
MDILILLIPMSVVLVLLVGAAFWWSVKSGQFDDLEGPAHRILADDDTSDAIPTRIVDAPDADTISTNCALTSVNPKRGPDR